MNPLLGIAVSIFLIASASAAPVAGGYCKLMKYRDRETGCWILSDQPVGSFRQREIYWHLDTFPARSAALAAASSRGTVVVSLGRTWLLTIEQKSWHPAGGKRVAQIGPLPIHAGVEYSAQFMEAVNDPGMTSAVHRHAGPEAWYMDAGSACLETPEGIIAGSASGRPMIVRGDIPMLLTATGMARRRAIALVLHETARPAITVVRDWMPKGLCAVRPAASRPGL